MDCSHAAATLSILPIVGKDDVRRSKKIYSVEEGEVNASSATDAEQIEWKKDGMSVETDILPNVVRNRNEDCDQLNESPHSSHGRTVRLMDCPRSNVALFDSTVNGTDRKDSASQKNGNPSRVKNSISAKRTTISRVSLRKISASLTADARSKSRGGPWPGHRTTAEVLLKDASHVTTNSSQEKTHSSFFNGDDQLYPKPFMWPRTTFSKLSSIGWGRSTRDDTAAIKFSIRGSQNSDLGRRLTQIYNRFGQSDKAWSYQSKPAIAVTGCICVIALWTLWFAPFIASFWNAYESLCKTLTRADLLLDAIYAVCNLLMLNISYVDMDSRVEVIEPTIIRKVMLMSPFFYYELLSTCLAIPVFVNGRSNRYILLFKLFRAANLWNLPRWMDRLRVKPMFQVVRLLAALFTVQHAVACLLNYVIEKEALWDDYTEQTKGDTDKYTFSYNYAINMLQAQISKNELLSRVEGALYCVVAPLGTLMVATLYGEINVLYQRLNLLADRHVENMAYITEAMKTLKLPLEMQHRVHQYFSLQRRFYQISPDEKRSGKRKVHRLYLDSWTKLWEAVLPSPHHLLWLVERFFPRFLHANRDKTALSTLLGSLSDPLLQELKLNLYGDLINKANFFKHCDPEFIRMIIMKLRDCVYCPGDNIIQTGQEGDCMFFILKGTVDVLIRESHVLASKVEGDYFGELALLKPGTSRTATLRARTYTIVACLYARDFDDALEKYPHEMMNAFAGMNLLNAEELATTLEEAKARIARAKEKKSA